MKKGINCWSLPNHLGLVEKMRFAKDIGFEGIELSITAEGELSLNTSDSELYTLKTAADKAGIIINSVACSMNWQYSITSNSEKFREMAKNNILRQLHVASVLESEVILALPGFVGVDFKSSDLFPDPNRLENFVGWEIVDYGSAWERAVTMFKQVAIEAEKKQIFVCVENIWSKFLLSPLEMKKFIEEIGSPYVQVYFDVGNVMLYGYPQQWIKILNEKIKMVHFKDFRKGSASLSGFVDLLSGDVDFIEVMKALHTINYNNWITAEVSTYRQFPEQSAISCSAAMDKILGMSLT